LNTPALDCVRHNLQRKGNRQVYKENATGKCTNTRENSERHFYLLSIWIFAVLELRDS
jgi:hypothetical protein